MYCNVPRSHSSQLVVYTLAQVLLNLAPAPMGSAFDKIVVLWTLCALTTLLCGVFLGVLYHILGQQIFVAGALHTLLVSVFVSFRFTALDGTSAIDAMMKSFGACAKGSLLAFDVWRRFSKTMRGPDDDDAPEEKAADKTFFERIVTQVSFLVGERLTFGIDADEATFLAEPSPVRKWMEGKYAFKVKEDLNCNAIDAKYLSVDGRYVARNGPGPRFVVVARK